MIRHEYGVFKVFLSLGEHDDFISCPLNNNVLNPKDYEKKTEVEQIYSRVCGKYKDGIPGIIEFWTIEGKVIYNS